MKILIKEDFLNTIPDIKREAVIKRLSMFADLLINEKKKIRELPSSFWVRKIRGSNNIYKFRLNSGDRILFTYSSDLEVSRNGYNNSIIFLAFINHDKQVIKAKSIKSFSVSQFEINRQSFPKREHIDIKIEKIYSDYYINLNNSKTVVTDDKSLKELIDKNDEKYLFYLNDEQYKCVEETKPVVLSGSAGSGKTTVGIHKIISSPPDSDVAYFTYTKRLRDNASSIFNRYFDNNNRKKFFYTVTDFLIEQNDKSFQYFVNFDIFNEWFLNNTHKYLYVQNISPIDLWAEIRGIIKGFMGFDWVRNRILEKSLLDANSLETLKKLKWIKNVNNGVVNWILEGQTHKEIVGHLKKNKVPQNIIDKILLHITNRSLKNTLIDKDIYLSLPNDYSIFDSETRSNIYTFAQKYQKWLKEESKFDENDLAFKSLFKIEKREIPLFDFIIIDEIQDLTELQIFVLINIAKNKSNIFLSGDIHQIINPTYFSFKRIKNLFHVNSIEIKRKHLSKNYRSQKYIVELANTLSDIRKEFIGSLGEYPELFNRSGEKPFFLFPSNQNLQALVNTINERHYAVIVVANIEDKEYLLQQLISNDNGRIFTINEIKGLEYSYVVTYNLISNFEKEWSDIFSGLAKKNSKYRYYFNLFYVGITRARNNLLIFEKNINNKLHERIKFILDFHTDFNIESLSLLKFSSPFEWMKEAERLEENEKYEQAIKAYRKAISIEEAKIAIIRCQAKKLAQKGKFEDAGNLLMTQELHFLNEDDIELIFKMFDKANTPYLRLKAEVWSGLFKPKEIDSKLEKMNKTVLDFIDFAKLSEDDLVLFNDNYFAPKLDSFNENIDNINMYLDIIKERN